MLKIEDVKVGDELVCIDRDGLHNEGYLTSQVAKFEKYIISGVCKETLRVNLLPEDGLDWRATNYLLLGQINKYFKKKEQSQYTFVQLQNLAHKSVIDGVLEYYHVEFYGDISLIKLAFDGKFTHYNSNDAKSGVEFIQSLYKETFVIESIEDIRRIKNSANITLSNGNRIERAVHENKGDYVVFNDSNDDFYTFDFVVLKGAKVEQSKV